MTYMRPNSSNEIAIGSITCGSLATSSIRYPGATSMLASDCCGVIGGTRSSLISDPGSGFLALSEVAASVCVADARTMSRKMRTREYKRRRIIVARVNESIRQCSFIILRGGLDRNRLAGVDGLLCGKTHRYRPAAVNGTARKLLAVLNGADKHRHLVLELEYFASDLVDWDLLHGLPVECTQRVARMQRTIQRTAPRSPERAFCSSDFHRLMVFERAQRLRHHGVRSAGKVNNGAEIVFQFRVANLPRGRGPINRLRLAKVAQIPTGQIEEMDRLFQDPITDAGN